MKGNVLLGRCKGSILYEGSFIFLIDQVCKSVD